MIALQSSSFQQLSDHGQRTGTCMPVSCKLAGSHCAPAALTTRQTKRKFRPASRKPRQAVMAAAEAETAAGSAIAATAAAQQTKRRLTYTSFEANAWQATFEQSGVTVLVDPWLVGDLTFAEQYWIYRGQKIKARNLEPVAIANNSDFILITQGLDDHCHLPTLEVLPRNIPVVAQKAAAETCRRLGYSDVRVLEHGQTLALADGRISATGTQGALVGPPWSERQLGVLFRETCNNGLSLYYEPHCDFEQDSTQRAAQQVDIVLTPVVNQDLGQPGVAAYPLVCGDDNAVDLLKLIRPKAVIPFENGKISASGPLSLVVKERGSVEGFRRKLEAAGLGSVQLLPAPEPVQPTSIEI